MKLCKKCNQTKSLDSFYQAKGGRYRGWCKECETRYRKQYQIANKNKNITIAEEKKCGSCLITKKSKDFHICLGNKDHLSNACKQCNNKTKNKQRELNKARNDSEISYPDTKKCCACKEIKLKENFSKSIRNSDGLHDMCKKCSNISISNWEKNNKDKVAIKNNKRRERKLLVDENFNGIELEITYKIFNNKCYKCGSDKDLCVDHNFPLSKGHALCCANAVILCKPCNSSKGTQDPIEFYATDEFLNLCILFQKATNLYNSIISNILQDGEEYDHSKHYTEMIRFWNNNKKELFVEKGLI